MRASLAAFALTFGAGHAQAQLAPPKPATPEIVVATSAALAPALRDAVAAYTAANPSARIHIVAEGSDVAMARLSTGRADIAVIGREAAEPEVKAYQWVFGRPPQATPMLRGSIAAPGYSPDLAVRVHITSPVRGFTLDELRERLAIGRDGRLVVPDVESGTGRFLVKMLRDGKPQFDWRRVTEVATPTDARTARAIARAVAADPASIGLGDAQAVAGTRIVPVDGVLPGEAGYPLARTVILYADPQPRAEAAAFLGFLHSDRGQKALVRDGWRPLR